jgi:hypothetical protein
MAARCNRPSANTAKVGDEAALMKAADLAGLADLIQALLVLDARHRPNAIQVATHPWLVGPSSNFPVAKKAVVEGGLACARAMADVLQPDDEDIMLRAMEEQEARMEKQEAEQKVGEGGAAAAAARTAASLFSVPVCCEPRPARQSRWPILSWLLGCRPCFVRWKCSPEAGEVAVPVVVICG